MAAVISTAATRAPFGISLDLNLHEASFCPRRADKGNLDCYREIAEPGWRSERVAGQSLIACARSREALRSALRGSLYKPTLRAPRRSREQPRTTRVVAAPSHRRTRPDPCCAPD